MIAQAYFASNRCLQLIDGVCDTYNEELFTTRKLGSYNYWIQKKKDGLYVARRHMPASLIIQRWGLLTRAHRVLVFQSDSVFQ